MDESYLRREELINLLEPPTQSEVKQRYPNVLGDAILDSLPSDTKTDLGLNPLHGPTPDTMGCPLTTTYTYIKSVTHDGILEIGGIVERKFMDQLNREIERKNDELREHLEEKAQRELKWHMDRVQGEFDSERDGVDEKIREEFEREKQLALQHLENELKIRHEREIACEKWKTYVEMEANIIQFSKNLETALQKKYDDALKLSVETIRAECEDRLSQLEQTFQLELIKKDHERNELLSQQEQLLEQSFIGYLSDIITIEQEKQTAMEAQTRTNHEAMVKKLTNQIEEQNDSLEKIREKIEIIHEDKESWREKTREILDYFRDFVESVMAVSPELSGLLVNVEHHLHFPVEPEKKREKCEQSTMTEHADDLKMSQEHKKSSVEMNEMMLGSVETLSDGVDLPEFIFRDHVYVREDVRNKDRAILSVDDKYVWDGREYHLKTYVEPIRWSKSLDNFRTLTSPRQKSFNITDKFDVGVQTDISLTDKLKNKPRLSLDLKQLDAIKEKLEELRDLNSFENGSHSSRLTLTSRDSIMIHRTSLVKKQLSHLINGNVTSPRHSIKNPSRLSFAKQIKVVCDKQCDTIVE